MKDMPCLNQHALVILLFLNRMSENTILWEGFILSHSFQGSNPSLCGNYGGVLGGG